MKPFALTPEMQTIGGVFYPTGHAVALFPSEEDARAAAAELQPLLGASEELQIQLISPDAALRYIGRSEKGSDDPLPSVGTEGATARAILDRARDGHWGLLVPAPASQDGELLVRVARRHHVAFAQRYRRLMIEDLV
ncbi:RNA-binding protein [Xylophilus sp.]|uniref:RNA-binding protein n=1 Tax=Xylophilus sp. TaxID=2653893 RepID=UPI0013B8C3F6|nr:RNA-binding protein [Xylophilus sp.]KAF1043344.1 MAG: hypothetical protein GAK38_03994 [Xylophilus sp.]